MQKNGQRYLTEKITLKTYIFPDTHALWLLSAYYAVVKYWKKFFMYGLISK